jgi:hypothetical protein
MIDVIHNGVLKASVLEEDLDWSKISTEQLIELLSQRVIYDTEDLLALDKPVS